jgi:hypothetical protein
MVRRCGQCGRVSDRGCIQLCRRCSGLDKGATPETKTPTKNELAIERRKARRGGLLQGREG